MSFMFKAILIAVYLVFMSMTCIYQCHAASTATCCDTDTKYMLHMEDTSLSDSSSAPHTISIVGNAARSNTQYKMGSYSMALDGAGDYLTSPDSDDMDFGTGDFTIDFWVYFNAVNTCAFFDRNDQGFDLRYSTSSGQIRGDTVGTSNVFSYPWSPSTSTWYHIAWTRSGSTMYLFINGTQVDSESNSDNITYTNKQLAIGTDQSQSYFINGYIDEFRWIKGTAVWTSTFTAPTSQYSDTCVTTNIKSINGCANASIKSINETARASVKSFMGVA